ncbi:MAG TPA: alkaline phosphatase family protein [Acidimicrobiia bacterium]|nr:alkaline phosphatase family protein [Acidimicrobiia bacterium]
MARVIPDYAGSGLVNLVADLELQLIGTAPMPGLTRPLPRAEGYVLVVFDGLGSAQMDHPAAGSLQTATVGSLTAGFPTTTTTSLSTLVTGIPPSRHGVIGHILHLPGVSEAVNVLKWVTPAGKPVAHDYASVLPAPNLWERLKDAGVEPITVQPGPFMDSPLSRMLYRSCRFEPAWSVEELVTATAQLARPGRLVLAYYPNLDVAAHVSGQDSEAYAIALAEAAAIWDDLARRLPDAIGLVATADHGHLDYGPTDKLLIRDRRYDDLRFFGDARSVYVSGAGETIDVLAGETRAVPVEAEEFLPWLGGEPHHSELKARLPDRLLLAPTGRVLLPRSFDKRLIGYHGGLEPAEVEIPLLLRS